MLYTFLTIIRRQDLECDYKKVGWDRVNNVTHTCNWTIKKRGTCSSPTMGEELPVMFCFFVHFVDLIEFFNLVKIRIDRTQPESIYLGKNCEKWF